jgi:hypothetical protein
MPSVVLPRGPLVLVATEDRAFYETLAPWFEDRARVRRVLSAADVVRELDEAGAQTRIVILDAKAPSVRPAALAILLESMRAVEVVMVRSEAETEQVVLSVSATCANWTVYRDPSPIATVAEACLTLVS